MRSDISPKCTTLRHQQSMFREWLVSRGVDLVQVHTNFEIGRRIVEQEQKGRSRANYGEEVIGALAERLTMEFGRGFSATNLAHMRTFYLLYRQRLPNLQSATAISSSDQTSQALSDQSPIFQSMTGKLGSPKKSQSLTGKSAIPGIVRGELSRNKKHADTVCAIADRRERPVADWPIPDC